MDITSFDTASKSNVKAVVDNQGVFHIIWLEGSWRRGQVKVRSGHYSALSIAICSGRHCPEIQNTEK